MGIDPVTIGLLAVSTAVSTAGAVEAGAARSDAAAYQGQIARNNAVVAEQNRNYALRAGAQDAEIASLKGRARLGAIKAAQAANNIDVNTGSALDVQLGERESSRLDTLNVMHNAMLKAYGYSGEAANQRSAATGYDQAGAAARKGALFGAAGSLLQGASAISSKWGGGDSSVDDNDNLEALG